MENSIDVRGLTKSYGDFALKNVDLQVPKGCVLGLVGKNGVGKTTLLKLILGLVNVDSGSVQVFGKDMAQVPKEIKENIGVVFDECPFDPAFTPKAIGGILGSVYSNWDSRAFERYMELFSLPMKKRIKSFSRGMKTKLTIATALAHESRLLLLDEPTSGLDPAVRDEILDIFGEYIQDEERSIVVSSHIISDLERIADYIALMDDGEIVFFGEKDRILEEYAILKGSAEQMERLDSSVLIGLRHSTFGADALVRRTPELERACEDMVLERGRLEEMLLYFIRGNER